VALSVLYIDWYSCWPWQRGDWRQPVQIYRLVLKHRRIDASKLVTNRLLPHWKIIQDLSFVWTLVRGSETSRKVPRTDAELCANCIHPASASYTRCAHLSQGESHSHASTPQLKACRWKQPSALLGCHSTLSLPGPGAGTVYTRTIKSRRDKVTNKTGTSVSLLNKTYRHF